MNRGPRRAGRVGGGAANGRAGGVGGTGVKGRASSSAASAASISSAFDQRWSATPNAIAGVILGLPVGLRGACPTAIAPRPDPGLIDATRAPEPRIPVVCRRGGR